MREQQQLEQRRIDDIERAGRIQQLHDRQLRRWCLELERRRFVCERVPVLHRGQAGQGDLIADRDRGARHLPRRDDLHILFAHPENAPAPEPPEVISKQLQLLGRLPGPNRDPELILFGTRDGLIPPSMAPLYKQLLVNGYIVYVYEAAHEMQFDRPEAVAEVVGDFRGASGGLVNATSALLNP